MAIQRILMRSRRAQAVPTPTMLSRLPITGIRYASTAPATIVDRGFWKSLVPKPLRRENRELLKKKTQEWNPATFFIVIFLLIGSMSIQMITLRNSFERYMRQSDIKISKLRRVVERIQNGEQVDVETELGTGDAKKEADWEELLQAIERDDAARKAQKEKEKEKTKRPEPQPRKTIVVQNEETESKPETARPKITGLGSFF